MREKFSFSIISNLISQFLTIISSYFLVLKFEVELMGIYGFANSVIALFSVFVTVGFESIYTQHVKDENFKDFFSVFFGLKTFSILLNYSPLYILIIFVNYEFKLMMLILLLARTISEFSLIFINHLTCILKVFKAKLPVFVIHIIESLAQIYLAINIDSYSNPLIILTCLILIFSFLKFFFIFIVSKGEFVFMKLNLDLLKRFLKETKPLMFMTIISVISTNIGNVLLGLSYGYETFAYYNLINNNIITFLLLITGSTQTMYMSLASTKFAEKKTHELKSIANLFEKYVSILFLFIIAFVFLNSRMIFSIFLPNYVPSLIYLYIMIFIPFFAGINRPYSLLLVPGRKQKLRAYYASIKIIIIIILQIIIVPQSIFSFKLLGLGAIGLSILNTIFWGSECFFYRYFSKKFFNISSYKKIYIPLISAILSYIISVIFKEFILILLFKNTLFILLFSSFMIFGIYFLFLWIFKEFKKEDLSFFLSLLNLKNYKESLLKELNK